MNEAPEIIRVSSLVLSWLDDPFSVPLDGPYCQWCGCPKRDRNRRCEICRQYGSITGPKKTRSNVFVEIYKPARVVKVRRKNAAAN